MDEAGNLSCCERPQEAPSTHETAPSDFLIESLAWRERREATPTDTVWHSGGVMQVFYSDAARK
jgi:hypothetical protein